MKNTKSLKQRFRDMENYDYQDNAFVGVVIEKFFDTKFEDICRDDDDMFHFARILDYQVKAYKATYGEIASAAVKYMQANEFNDISEVFLDALVYPFNCIAEKEYKIAERQQKAKASEDSQETPKKKSYFNVFKPENINRRFFKVPASKIYTVKYFYWFLYIPVSRFSEYMEYNSRHDKEVCKRIEDSVSRLTGKSLSVYDPYLIGVFKKLYSIRHSDSDLYYDCIYDILAAPFASTYLK